MVAVTKSYRYPGVLRLTRADAFALSSVIYYVVTKTIPYRGCSDNEIDRRIQEGEFPCTASLGLLGQIITKCWKAEYNSAQDIRNEIEGM